MTQAKDFADSIQNNPKAIVAWAKREIKEYQSLIKILEARLESHQKPQNSSRRTKRGKE